MRSKCFTAWEEKLVFCLGHKLWSNYLQAWVSLATELSLKQKWVVTHQSRVKFHQAHLPFCLLSSFLKGTPLFFPCSPSTTASNNQPHPQQHMLVPHKKKTTNPSAWGDLEVAQEKSRAAFLKSPYSNPWRHSRHSWRCSKPAKGWPRRPEMLLPSTTHPEQFVQLA